MSSITTEAEAFMNYLIEEAAERDRMKDPDYQLAMKEVEEFLSHPETNWTKNLLPKA